MRRHTAYAPAPTPPIAKISNAITRPLPLPSLVSGFMATSVVLVVDEEDVVVELPSNRPFRSSVVCVVDVLVDDEVVVGLIVVAVVVVLVGFAVVV